MARKFSFDNALLHFVRTEGAGGFLWKYLSAYIVLWLIYAAANLYVMAPMMMAYGDMMRDLSMGGDGNPEALEQVMLQNAVRIGGGFAALLPIALVLWAAFEAAIQRRYIRNDGFRLRFGSDELRLIVVGIIWFLFLMAGYLAFAAFAGVAVMLGTATSSAGAFIGLSILIGFASLFLWVWMAIRLSPAAALTIRDRRIRFFDAWAVTRGRAWPMLGAFFLLILGYYFAVTLVYMIGGMGAMGMMMSNPEVMEAVANEDPEAMMAFFVSPAVLVPLILAYIVMMLMQGLFQYAWAGPAALAAKTDPRQGGQMNIDETFT